MRRREADRKPCRKCAVADLQLPVQFRCEALQMFLHVRNCGPDHGIGAGAGGIERAAIRSRGRHEVWSCIGVAQSINPSAVFRLDPGARRSTASSASPSF